MTSFTGLRRWPMTRATCLALGLALLCPLAASADDVEPKAGAEKVKKLQTERRDVLKKLVEARENEFMAGRGTLDVLLGATRDPLQAELELATTPKQRLAAHAARLELAKKIEEVMKNRHDAGRATQADYLQSQAARLDAEIGGRRAGGEEKKDRKHR